MAQENGRRMAENRRPVSPAPDVSRLSAPELSAALRAQPYRASAFLVMRLVRGQSLEDCAAFYGISPSAFSTHLLRAALELTRTLTLPCRPPENEAEEDVWARGLADALEHESVGAASALTGVVDVCRRVRALGSEVAAALDAAEQEEEQSPRRRREELLRKLAVLALVALTLWLYLHRPPEPPERPASPVHAPAH